MLHVKWLMDNDVADVADLLHFKLLIHNDVTDVAGFPTRNAIQCQAVSMHSNRWIIFRNTVATRAGGSGSGLFGSKRGLYG
jgi:hypothetical protein